MEILYILTSIFVLLFILLAVYDGLYLHLWCFELFKRKESLLEHKTHTMRAILFPLIIAFYFLGGSSTLYFYIGISLIILDLIVLGIDAYSETDSRLFMGGLPRWEYIIHLFTNSFHFASICLLTATKISLTNNTVLLNLRDVDSPIKHIFDIICINILPGAMILAIIHILLMTTIGKRWWSYIKPEKTLLN
ncbi:MAG: hypothetical protein WBO31_03890 [Saprospiraceae bacterium]